LQELPGDQQALLLHNTDVERIKILVEEKIVSGCIQYKHYCAWYESVFENSIDIPVLKIVEKELLTSPFSLSKV
jgi:hypothetical protein